jgi:glycosyltransferase involved in cell wall biosynthesis
MRIVTICLPAFGGIYSVFLNLRRALQPYGAELTWVAAGKSIARQALEAATAQDLAAGALLATETDDELAKAAALLRYIAEINPALVLFHVFGGPLETNLARYLPGHTRRVLVVHSITHATYRAARAIRDWVHATVGVSPRIASDIVRRYGFDPAWTSTIPNAIDTSAFAAVARGPAGHSNLRILCHGRVEHASKGVLWLGAILDEAARAGLGFTLTVSGDGPDLPRLKTELLCRRLAERVRFMGAVLRQDVPRLMANHDVLLFPSIFEGFAVTLVEAMASGCVPVASRIRGVTDAIVEDGKSGLLFPPGNAAEAAAHLVSLDRDRRLLSAMSRSAATTTAARYGLAPLGAAYDALFRRVLESPRASAAPLPLSEWRMPPFLQPGWRRFVPSPVKNALRLARESL